MGFPRVVREHVEEIIVKGSVSLEAILLDFRDTTVIKGVIHMFLEAILPDFRDMTVIKGVTNMFLEAILPDFRDMTVIKGVV